MYFSYFKNIVFKNIIAKNKTNQLKAFLAFYQITKHFKKQSNMCIQVYINYY